MKFKELITKFFNYVESNKIYLYNEFSLQFELSSYLRNELPGIRVELERNISYLGLDKKQFVKSEMDILISNIDLNNQIVIELKAPINQRNVRPVTVFDWIKDLRFLEQLKVQNIKGYSIFITDNQGYLRSKGTTKPLLRDFRQKYISGSYCKHIDSKNKNKSITLVNDYKFEWNELGENFYYFIIEA